MLESKNNWKAWLYLAPALVLLGIFTFYPLFNAFYLSFLKDYNPMIKPEGGYSFTLYNYVYALTLGSGTSDMSLWQGFLNSKFLEGLRNVAIIAVVSVPLSIVISLLIAVALNSIKKLRGLFQTIFFLPYVTNSIAVGMAFAIMFSYTSRVGRAQGLINYFIEFFGGKAINWVGKGAETWATMTALLIYTVWGSLAFKIIVFLSGLQGIDKQYYDAAKIDGTSKRRILWRITVPLLSPTILYISITSFIGAFKTYSSVVGLLGKDMGESAIGKPIITIVGLVYDNIEYTEIGALSRAAAISVLLFVIILIFTAIQGLITKKKVHY